MTNQEAIKYLQQIYPNGGHCWLDEQRMEAISMAVNALQEEPVSEELEEAALRANMIKKDIPKEFLSEYPYNRYGYHKFIEGAKWQKTKDESITEDLGEYINELSKQFPGVSFAKLSRIAVRVAKWQKEQFEKNRLADCDRQTEEEAEIERDFCMGIIENEHRQPTFDDAIKYGMRLKEKEMQSTIELAEDHAMLAGMEKMKEEMMAKAKSGTVQKDNQVILDNGTYIDLDPSMQLKPSFVGLKEGDRIKVIIIKED